MGTGYKKPKTPFTAENVSGTVWLIANSAGEDVATTACGTAAAFIVKACNRYDMLMIAHNLCRDRMVGEPRAKKYDARPFLEISAAIAADIDTHGR